MAYSCVRVLFEIGHEASIRSKRTPEGFTHDWELFVRGADNTEINHFVEKVVFYLHDTFPNPVRVVKEPPYLIKESGYAGFNPQIDIYFRTDEEPKKIRFNYDLNLQQSGPSITKVQREKYVFRNPDEDLRRRLIRGGGVGVGSDAGSHSSGDKPGVVSSTTDDAALKSSGIQLVSKPKLGGDTPKKHKSKEHRSEEPRVSNSFEDFFGNIKKPSPSSKVSPVPKPSKPAEKVSSEKSPSVSKPSAGKSSSGGVKEEKSKERDKSKEKEKEKSKHTSTSVKPSKEEPKKPHSESSKSEKKKKDKRSKDEKSKKERHESKDKKPEEKPKDKEKTSSRHKHKKKRDESDKERDRDKEKKPKKSSSDSKKPSDSKDKEPSKKHVQSPPQNSPSPKPLPVPDKPSPAPLPPPPLPPVINKEKPSKKPHSQRFEEVEPNSSPLSADEDLTPSVSDSSNKIESTVKPEVQSESIKPKLEESSTVNKQKDTKKSKDEAGRESSKKRKRKSSGKVKDEDLSTEEVTGSKLAKVELEVKSSEPVATPTSTQFSPDYVSQLKELQRKIMTLEDNAELQRVVQVIAETGQYEITKKTFDFDLCALDRSTVKRLQDFFTTS